MSAKPTLWAYAENLARRFSGAQNTLHPFTHSDPCAFVVGVLAFAAEDDRIEEYDRARCQEWLDRLVWPNGEPKPAGSVGEGPNQ